MQNFSFNKVHKIRKATAVPMGSMPGHNTLLYGMNHYCGLHLSGFMLWISKHAWGHENIHFLFSLNSLKSFTCLALPRLGHFLRPFYTHHCSVISRKLYYSFNSFSLKYHLRKADYAWAHDAASPIHGKYAHIL